MHLNSGGLRNETAPRATSPRATEEREREEPQGAVSSKMHHLSSRLAGGERKQQPTANAQAREKKKNLFLVLLKETQEPVTKSEIGKVTGVSQFISNLITV